MPFDGNGNFTPSSPSYPAVAGQTITAAKRNTLDLDFATGLSNCVTRDGQSPPTANLPMGSFKLTGLAAGSTNGDSVRYEQLFGSVPILSTEQATTSGTSIDFTSIPSWAKRITINFMGVSTDGTSKPQIQIGDAGGVETTAYLSTSALLAGAAVSLAVSTSGFTLHSEVASSALYGSIVLTLADDGAFTWVATGTLGIFGAVDMLLVAGSKALSAALDRVRLTTVNGTDAFNAGKVSILYE